MFLSRLFYIALGFVIGYMLDNLKKQNQEEVDFYTNPADFEEKSVEDIVVEIVSPVEKEPDSVQSASAESQHDNPNFLTQINGIGATYAKRIFDSGVHSMKALSECDPQELSEIAKIKNLEKVGDWIKQAKESL